MLRGDPGYFRPLRLDTHADSPIWAHMLLPKVLALARVARVPRPMSPCWRASISRPLLNPDKVVLRPDLKAGCSLAASITSADIRLCASALT